MVDGTKAAVDSIWVGIHQISYQCIERHSLVIGIEVSVFPVHYDVLFCAPIVKKNRKNYGSPLLFLFLFEYVSLYFPACLSRFQNRQINLPDWQPLSWIWLACLWWHLSKSLSSSLNLPLLRYLQVDSSHLSSSHSAKQLFWVICQAKIASYIEKKYTFGI